MEFRDLCDVRSPRVSVITPSLNHAAFLKDTIETVASQSYRNFEHIVIDGGSTDGTVDVLRSYPHLRWISEKDRDIVDAYRKALSRVRGEYVIQCCVSDGFHDRRWFQTCVDTLDSDPRTALVWGLPQYMTEGGALQGVSYVDLLDDPPPTGPEFIAYWWATKMPLPEGNYCVRAEVIKAHFPTDDSPEHFRVHPHLGFMHAFMTGGYQARFVPAVVNFGRAHADQRGRRLWHIERPAQLRHLAATDRHRRDILSGRLPFVLRDGASNEVAAADASLLARLRAVYRWERFKRSPWLRLPAYQIVRRIGQRLRRSRPA